MKIKNKLIVGLCMMALTLSFGWSSSVQAQSFVYVASNDTDGNILYGYRLSRRGGNLRQIGMFPTGGVGTGGGLGNQGAVSTGKRSNRWVAVVNAGSDDVSLFSIEDSRPVFSSKVESGGVSPVSVDFYRSLLYVLNAGGGGEPSNISGFRIVRGELVPITGSTRTLSADSAGSAQIAFSPDGSWIAVTEKATNIISMFSVNTSTGLLSEHISTASNGQTPFGFKWSDRNTFIVSEAFGGTDSAVSEYDVQEDGGLTVVSGSIDAGEEQAACWVEITRNGRFAYVTNTATNSISLYSRPNESGVELTTSRSLETLGGPIDFAINRPGLAGAVLNNSGSLQSFRVNQRSGELTLGATVDGIPAGTNGMVILE